MLLPYFCLLSAYISTHTQPTILISERHLFSHSIFGFYFLFSPNQLNRGQLETTVGEEKKYNPRLTKDIDSFIQIMDNLNLPRPKLIGKCVQSTEYSVRASRNANRVATYFHWMERGASCEILFNNIRWIDVLREPEGTKGRKQNQD